MSLPNISVNKHVFTVMLNFLFILFGIISLKDIGNDKLPKVEMPVISVITAYDGANPEVVDRSVTSVLESSLNTVTGLDNIKSNSTIGLSVVTLTFDIKKNIDSAFSEVQEKISQTLRKLPGDVDPPYIRKVETNTQSILWLSLFGDRTLSQLNDIAKNNVIKKIETVDGVGNVRIGGEKERTINIVLSIEKIYQLKLSMNEIKNAITNSHIVFSGGFYDKNKSELLVNLDLEKHSIDELKNIPIPQKNIGNLKLSDVAEVSEGFLNERKFAKRNGIDAVSIGISKIANANTLTIIEKIKSKISKEIIQTLPPGVKLEVVSDDSIYISNLLNNLKEHLILGTFFAGLVVLLFLRNFISTLIIILSVPISLLGSVVALYFFGYTLNIITLLAMLLLIGVVVDDAIVVLENINRKLRSSSSDFKQKFSFESEVIKATEGVMFPVLASTISLVAIFVPVIFLSGLLGKFLQPFAVVTVIGILVSWLVSLTITPMLSAKLSRENSSKTVQSSWTDIWELRYKNFLKKNLDNKFLSIAIFSLCILICALIFVKIGKGFTPETDESKFYAYFRLPLGSNIEHTKDKLKEIESYISTHNEILNYLSIIGFGSSNVNEGRIIIRLVPKSQREKSQKEIIAKFREQLKNISGIKISVSNPSIVGSGKGDPLQFDLSGYDYNEVYDSAHKLKLEIDKDNELNNIDVKLINNVPQLKIKIDQELAAKLGISPRDVIETVNYVTHGRVIGSFNSRSDPTRYPIIMKTKQKDFLVDDFFKYFSIKNSRGELIPLDSILKFTENVEPYSIKKASLKYSVEFYGSPNIPLGLAVDKIKKISKENLSSDLSITFSGQSEEFNKTIKNIKFTFLLAIILLYMVLACQFNSFLQPFYIMLTQPLATAGGLIALFISNQTLNIFSMIGLVLLIGLVVKNSILIIDNINKKRDQGNILFDSVVDATPTRLRPIFMTSLTLTLAMLPAAFGLGDGNELIQPLATVIIGGTIFSTILTLFLIPLSYYQIENFRSKYKKEII